MRKNILKITCILVISLSVTLSGCFSTNPKQVENITDSENISSTIDSAMETSSAGNFKEISVDEAYNIFISDKDYLFIDVRSNESYDKSHIKGALNIPVPEIKDNLNEIPQDKIIIVYCSGSVCDVSSMAAEILVQNGFTQVYKIGGLGINEWIEKEYPVE